jgi:iron(III) transport system ATP-binding protein
MSREKPPVPVTELDRPVTAASGAEAAVEFRGVTKRYGPVMAVDSVSFTVAKGSLVTLLGPSGCGKTTTLRLVAGLESASDGTIRIGGRDVTHLSAADRDVSMVFQSYALFPHMSVLENVAYGLVVGGTRKTEAHRRAREKLALVGLTGVEQRSPSELSGGQQQRVAVARAIVLEPEVLLLDEPLSNLDAKLRRRVRDDLRRLQQSLGLTVVYVTHDQEEALAVSDRIIVMSNARIAQDGTPRDLYERPASRFVADFIGDANLVAGSLLRLDERRAEIAVAGVRLVLPHHGLADGPVDLAVRPDALVVEPAGAADALPGTVAAAAYIGTHLEYTVTTSLGELFVVAHDTREMLRVGAAVALRFADRGITVIPRS